MTAARQPSLASQVAAARLRAAGHRATGNRLAIVDVLAGAGQPLTISQILDRRSGLALSSVYRNLAVLERARVVRRLLTSGDFARYELSEDLAPHHHHLVCASCGAVEDFAAAAPLERHVREAMAEVAERAGFTSQSHRLDLIGLCRSCT